MDARVFKPSSQYMTKLGLNVTLLATAIGVAGLLMGWLISLDEGAREGGIVATVIVVLNTAWWLVGILLIGPYYRSLSYEIQDDEVIVRVGIFVKSVKHVPYRTVTNIAIKRDIFDRWFFGIGTLNIQTAGMSGAKGAEESLVGLPNHQEAYEIVAAELRRFRSGMAPTAAESDGESIGGSARVLDEILSEIKAIRRAKDV